MRRKRKLMVHAHFQLRRSLVAGLIAMLISGAFSGGMVYITLTNNARLGMVRAQVHEMKTDESRPSSPAGDQIDMVMISSMKVIPLSVILVLVVSCGVFFLMMKNTSGVSGQMVLLGNYLDLMSEGIKPEIRHLRKDDSFHFVFEKLGVYLRNLP